MKLMTKDLREKIPALYATESTPMGEKVAIVKYFTPWARWTWYVVEFDGEDRFFGLVDGLEREFGYFSLNELENVRGGRWGLGVERDLFFRPTRLVELYPELDGAA